MGTKLDEWLPTLRLFATQYCGVGSASSDFAFLDKPMFFYKGFPVDPNWFEYSRHYTLRTNSTTPAANPAQQFDLHAIQAALEFPEDIFPDRLREENQKNTVVKTAQGKRPKSATTKARIRGARLFESENTHRSSGKR
jgi:hypothetical protein